MANEFTLLEMSKIAEIRMKKPLSLSRTRILVAKLNDVNSEHNEVRARYIQGRPGVELKWNNIGKTVTDHGLLSELEPLCDAYLAKADPKFYDEYVG